MVFSSVYFTFLFLPICILVYYVVKRRSVKNIVLVVASLIFYAYGEPQFVFVLFASIVINYSMVLLMNNKEGVKRRVYCIFIIVIDLLLLICCKYISFFTTIINDLFSLNIKLVNVGLPIGVSFFTFQLISYAVDVYKRRNDAEKNIINVALYIAFFPQLIAGPIIRYHSISEQIHNRKESYASFGAGAERFMLGFGKKVIIANNISIVVEPIFNATSFSGYSIIEIWIAIIGFALQIYYDFSGYSDMAIGLAKIFGFDFDENFNYPYIAKSITDFWRR